MLNSFETNIKHFNFEQLHAHLDRSYECDFDYIIDNQDICLRI